MREASSVEIRGHRLREETVLEIGRFSILWSIFENEFCHLKCTSAVLAEIAPTLTIDPEARLRFVEALRRRCSLRELLAADYVHSSLHPSGAHLSSEEEQTLMRQFIEQTGSTLNLGCLLIIRRLRNNLMHGLKLPEDLDGQLELFRAMNGVLEHLSRN